MLPREICHVMIADLRYALRTLAKTPGQMAMVGACVAGAYALTGVILTGMLPEPSRTDENA